MAHRLHLYLPQCPHTEHNSLGGSFGGGVAAVKYVGMCGGRLVIPDSSISVAKFLRYSKAVRTFMLDFFFLLPSFKCRLSEMV
jgi:hypothetical protein